MLQSTLATLSAVLAPLLANEGAGDWPQWRGPLATGYAPDSDPPIHWSEEKNVRFKTPIPGAGYGSPVVWGDLVLLTASNPVGPKLDPVPDDAPGAHDNATVTHEHEFLAFAVDRKSGEIAWRMKLGQELPHAGYHDSSALVAASAATDGEHVIAFFGSYGIYCLDLEGFVMWKKDLGDMEVKHGHGEGATPLLVDGVVVVNWDHEGDSFVVALDAATGEEKWRKSRDEPTSWASPLAIERGEGESPLVVLSGTNRIRAYDLSNGDVVWHSDGLSNNVVATPLSDGEMLFAGSSYVRKRMVGITLDGAKGDISRTDHVVWRRQRGTPYVPSPLLLDGTLYFLNHYQGFLTRVDAKTGNEPHRPVRLNGLRDIYASPVGAKDRIYITGRDGVTAVLRHGEGPPEVIALNVLEDDINASAAIVGDEIYLRGRNFLYAIAEDGD